MTRTAPATHSTASIASSLMTSPLDGEPLISLSQAAARYPGCRGSNRMHVATLARWISRGTLTSDGRRVRLEAIRVGSRWMTSTAALARYSAALTPSTASAPPAATPAQRTRAALAASRELDALLS